jgi:hypothetical protein
MRNESVWCDCGIFDVIELWKEYGFEFPINDGIHEFLANEKEC